MGMKLNDGSVNIHERNNIEQQLSEKGPLLQFSLCPFNCVFGINGSSMKNKDLSPNFISLVFYFAES